MNTDYQPNPIFPRQQVTPSQFQPQFGVAQQFMPAVDTPPGFFPMERSYIENILRANKGKLANVYMTFTDSTEWRDKVFTGIIEDAGIDNIIMSDPQTGKWYLLKIIYLDYVSFDEEITTIPMTTVPTPTIG